MRPQVVFSARGYVLFDDTVLDKHHNRRIGLVNCVYVNPETDQFWLIDYRLFAPDADGKTKPEHVADLLSNWPHVASPTARS